MRDVKNEPGYEELPIAYEGWEDNDVMPWDEIAKDIEDNLSGLDPKLMFEWFQDNEERIDWDEFTLWADEI